MCVVAVSGGSRLHDDPSILLFPNQGQSIAFDECCCQRLLCERRVFVVVGVRMRCGALRVVEKKPIEAEVDETENARDKNRSVITNSVCSRSRIQGLKGITFLLFVVDGIDLFSFCPARGLVGFWILGDFCSCVRSSGCVVWCVVEEGGYLERKPKRRRRVVGDVSVEMVLSIFFNQRGRRTVEHSDDGATLVERTTENGE